MEKLYYHLPYVREFEAEVVSCREGKKGCEVVLTRTGFYPEGGGQPSDTGFLNGVRVSGVHERDGVIVHIAQAALEPGAAVWGTVDWEERFSNMQQHTGEHIVSGLIHAKYGYDNVGFHMGKEEVTIDLNGVLTWAQLMEIEREANRIVCGNVPVAATYPSGEELKRLDYRSKKELAGQVRIVTVPGADVCACCGTHVERTGEIGVIKFLSLIHYKGGVRLSLLCGEKALRDYERKTDQENRISVLLSARPDKLAEAVERMKQESADKDARIGELTRKFLELRASQIEGRRGRLLVFEEGLKPVQVRQFCNLLLEQGKAPLVLVCSENGQEGYSYCIGSQAYDVRKLSQEMNRALDGRGGGSPQMAQGTFFAGREAIGAYFEQREL